MLLLCDATSTAALLTRVLGTSPQRRVQSIAIEHAGSQVRLTLRGVRTGLSLFGATVPPIDARLLLHSEPLSDQRITIRWAIEHLDGVPTMAASLVGKATIAGFLLDALRTADPVATWRIADALTLGTPSDSGDLTLDLSRIEVPWISSARIASVTVPADERHVLGLAWSC
jgi:hypothetical protein